MAKWIVPVMFQYEVEIEADDDDEALDIASQMVLNPLIHQTYLTDDHTLIGWGPVKNGPSQR